MIDTYYLVAAIAYGIFILQFILSWVGGHTDVDIDFDSHADFDIGDLVSFKGLIHFMMGFSGWTASQEYFNGEVTYLDWSVGIIAGIVLVFILYYLYKFCMKLQYIPKREPKEALVGRWGKVYLKLTDRQYIILIPSNGQEEEVDAWLVEGAETCPKTGDLVKVVSFEDSKYFIH